MFVIFWIYFRPVECCYSLLRVKPVRPRPACKRAEERKSFCLNPSPPWLTCLFYLHTLSRPTGSLGEHVNLSLKCMCVCVRAVCAFAVLYVHVNGLSASDTTHQVPAAHLLSWGISGKEVVQGQSKWLFMHHAGFFSTSAVVSLFPLHEKLKSQIWSFFYDLCSFHVKQLLLQDMIRWVNE